MFGPEHIQHLGVRLKMGLNLFQSDTLIQSITLSSSVVFCPSLALVAVLDGLSWLSSE